MISYLVDLFSFSQISIACLKRLLPIPSAAGNNSKHSGSEELGLGGYENNETSDLYNHMTWCYKECRNDDFCQQNSFIINLLFPSADFRNSCKTQTSPQAVPVSRERKRMFFFSRVYFCAGLIFSGAHFGKSVNIVFFFNSDWISNNFTKKK